MESLGANGHSAHVEERKGLHTVTIENEAVHLVQQSSLVTVVGPLHCSTQAALAEFSTLCSK